MTELKKDINELHELISELIKDNIDIVDIDKYENLYLKIRRKIEENNKSVVDWYDEKYWNNLKNLKNKLIEFDEKTNQENIFKVDYGDFEDFEE